MNRKVLVTLLVLAAVTSSTTQAADLIVNVTGVREHKGMLSLAVYDSAATWDANVKTVAADQKAPDADQVTFHFTNLPAGKVAVMAMHDKNGNGKLDSNFMGMPTEGYGFSNNPKVMRKAHFDEATVEVGKTPTTITLKLR
ncbi:MAG: DUF2141 domain-containing protein [Dokdonella sp.]